MTDIRSRVTLEQIVRKGILVLMVTGFCVSFAYDGWKRYPRKNAEQIVKTLDPRPESVPAINPAVTRKAAASLEKRAKERFPLRDVVLQFGEPGWRSANGSTVYYLGPAGVLTLSTVADTVIDAKYRDAGYKSEFDLLVQKVLAVVLAVLGIPLLVHYVRVLTFTTRLTDAGLKISGKPLVPFEAMTAVNAERFKEKGWMDIGYTREGVDGTLRLDEYWIRRLPDILAAICERKGFANPLDKPAPPGRSP